MSKTSITGSIKENLPSGLDVFLVALPLCLGIALASGAPPLSGVISGIIGGIVVGFISNSNISVSGPAAGLTAIVIGAITDLGAFNLFLCAGIIAGIIQLAMGYFRAGSISNFFPTNVIEGMLAGIGIIIILKQLTHAVGFDNDFEGNITLFTPGFGLDHIGSYIQGVYQAVHPGAVVITLVSLAILIVWDKVPKLKQIKFLPGALVAVILSILLQYVFKGSLFEIGKEHMVQLPVPNSLDDFKNMISLPDFSGFLRPEVWKYGAIIAVVASIETLLCIEASDRLDKRKRITDTNLELKAQGIGNMVSSLLGGLPMTSVVVRSSVNANSGATHKTSAILHGILLLVCVLTIPFYLNMIPYATLAAILLMVGYKLANPVLFKHLWYKGKYQFIPFIATVIVVVGKDLLTGVGVGLFLAIYFTLQGNMKRAYY